MTGANQFLNVGHLMFAWIVLTLLPSACREVADSGQ